MTRSPCAFKPRTHQTLRVLQPNDAACAIWSVTDLTVQPKVGLRQARRSPSQTNADPISRAGVGPHVWN
jgi:hypothetical protein